MRKKEIEKAAVKQPKTRKNEDPKREWKTTVQEVNGVLVFNIFRSKRLLGRHCVNPETGEHANWIAAKPAENGRYPKAAQAEMWSDSQIGYIYTDKSPYEYNMGWGSFRWSDKYDKITALDSTSDELVLMNNKAFSKKFKETILYKHGNKDDRQKAMLRWRNIIADLEDDYDRDKRVSAEERRQQRVQDLMERVPEIPEDFNDWIYDKMFKGLPGDALYDSEENGWYCSECHLTSPREDYKGLDGKPGKMNRISICPECGAQVILHKKPKRYTQVMTYSAKCCLVSELKGTDECSVMRHFYVTGTVDPIYKDTPEHRSKPGKFLTVKETIRVVMYKQLPTDKILLTLERIGRHAKGRGKKAFVIYYAGYRGEFDYKSNICHHTAGKGWLYPNGETISKAFKDTVYEPWGKFFEYASRSGEELDYNKCMCCTDKNVPGVVEMLYKGRFYKLCRESIDNINVYSGSLYYQDSASVNYTGHTAAEVLMLSDGQAINRLRDINGGKITLGWLRWSLINKKKISQDALLWFDKWEVSRSDASFMLDRMNPDQIRNYVDKQRTTSYSGNASISGNPRLLINQWQDYLNMAKDLKKKVNDEMVYKPTDLKLRHDEYVEECNRRQEEIRARKDKEYAREQKRKLDKKFPEARKVLKDIKEKLEWSNDDFIIKTPEHLTDIIFEGQQLHHCAGATDRYFDRICQRETYIVFLRKAAEPDKPYYTIEVEPGGVIRQHRGMYDEEPEIELVKPALREWQKEIRKRMKEEDRKAAEISKKKRAENIRELEEKKNLRVLKALMDDFMDIEEEEQEQAEQVKTKGRKKKTA
jgi:hypothetical protein